MDYFQPHTRKNTLKINNKRLSQEQVGLLETSFNCNNKLDPDRKSQLAQELGLPPRQVAIWYQNKRARWKNQSLEVDHKALQQRLENVLAHNIRLEGEVERLKEELDKAKEMLVSLNTTPYSSLSSSCDEVGSSGLVGGSKYGSNKEFYDCLIGAENQFGKLDGYDFFAQSIS